jgi:uncharacterized membrane protein YGL010W
MTESARFESRFDWVRRMGVHEAYHLHPINRLIHWICIPLELAAVVKLLGVVPAPVDLGFVTIVAVGVLYGLADEVAGACMTLLLLALYALVTPLTSGSAVLDALAAAVVFAAAFTIQTRVGHGVFEHGIDDTEMNLAEFGRTKNPIPLLLIFAYHGLELLFAAGYRPAISARVEEHRRGELARIPNDPRR